MIYRIRTIFLGMTIIDGKQTAEEYKALLKAGSKCACCNR